MKKANIQTGSYDKKQEVCHRTVLAGYQTVYRVQSEELEICLPM